MLLNSTAFFGFAAVFVTPHDAGKFEGRPKARQKCAEFQKHGGIPTDSAPKPLNLTNSKALLNFTAFF